LVRAALSALKYASHIDVSGSPVSAARMLGYTFGGRRTLSMRWTMEEPSFLSAATTLALFEAPLTMTPPSAALGLAGARRWGR